MFSTLQINQSVFAYLRSNFKSLHISGGYRNVSQKSEDSRTGEKPLFTTSFQKFEKVQFWDFFW